METVATAPKGKARKVAAPHTKRIGTLGPLLQVEYQVRHDEDSGVILAYRTDEVDTWGKRTYFVVLPDGDLQQWYLFPDEVLSEAKENA